jgi:glycosyltransferase involved in cell wall biosynthesis
LNLLIISHTPHFEDNNAIVGWGSTIEEINQMALIFSRIVHIGFLHDGPPPLTSLAYERNIRFIPLPPAGGKSGRSKIGVLAKIPIYIKEILAAIRSADAVHVRCPANVSLIALMLLTFLIRPKIRWVKYAGNWKPESDEPWSYAIQRWWLAKKLHRGTVTVNGNWPKQPRHIFSFNNPSLTVQEIELGRAKGREKQLLSPYRIMFAGALIPSKGPSRALQIVKELSALHYDVRLDILGDGIDRPLLEAWSRENGLQAIVTFHGWMPRHALPDFYQKAHFLILPSSSEGWPKVLSEAMAFGTIPIAGKVSCVSQILEEAGSGSAVHPDNIQGFVKTFSDYITQPERWKKESLAGIAAASQFTYEHYLDSVKQMFRSVWGVSLT